MVEWKTIESADVNGHEQKPTVTVEEAEARIADLKRRLKKAMSCAGCHHPKCAMMNYIQEDCPVHKAEQIEKELREAKE